MKHFFCRVLAVFFPFTIFLMLNELGYALCAFLLQASMLGWLPASIWAFKVLPRLWGQTTPPSSS